jgi:hypothetical protein
MRSPLSGAVVDAGYQQRFHIYLSIYAMDCQTAIAAQTLELGGDDLLAVKGNQEPGALVECRPYGESPPVP